MPPRVADLVSRLACAAPLDGAAVGEAAAGGLVVRVGLWREGDGLRARFAASTCAALLAYAEAACAAIDAGAAPGALDDDAVRALVAGVHPLHHDRAALVSRAVQRARERLGGAVA